MPALYPIRAVSKLTGLSIDTLRAWERRYQAVEPTRTVRGRLYTEANINRLILLRTAVERGHAIGQVASLPDRDLEELARVAGQLRPHSSGGAPSGLESVLNAIEAFDYDRATDELTRLAMLASPRALAYDVVLPLMRTVGEYWQSGKFQVSQEHLLSACVRNLVGGMIRQRGVSGSGISLMLTTPQGELHEFGILAAAMLAVAYDFRVMYLGPNLPAAEIVTGAAQSSARVVALGIMDVNVNEATAAEIGAIARELSAPAELWLGGSGAARVLETAGVGARTVEARGLDIFAFDTLEDYERQLNRLKGLRGWMPAQ